MQTISRVNLELRSSDDKITIAPNISYSHFKIEQLCIPHVWNYLPAGDLIFTDSLGVVNTLPTPPQQPSVSDMINLLNVLTLLDSGGATYSLTVNTLDMTITFNGTANFGLSFDKWLAQHLGVTNSLGGDRYGWTGVNTYTTGHFMLGTQQLLVSTGLQVLGQGTSMNNYTEPMSTQATEVRFTTNNIVLPVHSAIGEIETWYLGDWGISFPIGLNPMQLSIKITDEFGLPIDVAPQRMYLTIVYFC